MKMIEGKKVSATALRTLPIFQGIESERLDAIASVCVMRRVQRGTVVILEGEIADCVYFVLTGSLKIYIIDEEGREVIFSLIDQGDVFGEIGIVDRQPRSATVIATSASDLVCINLADFRKVLQDNFEVSLRVMGKLARRLRDADRKIESLALMDVYGRVARLLLDLAEEIDGQSIVRKRVSKQDIAKMIGASREMVSRVMKDLQTRGLIDETDLGVVLFEKMNEI